MTPSKYEDNRYIAINIMGWEEKLFEWTQNNSESPDRAFDPCGNWNNWRQVEEWIISNKEDKLLALYFLKLNSRDDDVITISSIRSGKVFNMIKNFFQADLPKRCAALIAAHKEIASKV